MNNDGNLNDADQSFEIPVLGSLGLLALGDEGLRKWREVRDKELAKLMQEKKGKGKKK